MTVFRLARADEAPHIHAFQMAMAFETEKLQLDAATCAKGVAVVLNRPEFGRYHVCEVDGAVTGSLLSSGTEADLFRWSCDSGAYRRNQSGRRVG